MPTIHVYLPDHIHSELKRLAAKRGMRVSELVRLFILEGLEAMKAEEGVEAEPARRVAEGEDGERVEARVARRQGRVDEAVLEKLMEIQVMLEKMRQSFEDRLVDLESQLFEMQEEVRKLKAKVHRLEDAYEDIVNPVHVEHVAAHR
ncbi:hypothetical protein Pyrfu_1221 [Pyrolobus fumarii 1A]|uniref:CopG domain protein DNA-binding domain protein n=2 Tax=Pyrolobus fumarii TaxID=54252 RepID=G0EFY0_PYRF1|nr:hypothetical protein Pyrfu_1221 [Pyrolobus fumarii 1A]